MTYTTVITVISDVIYVLLFLIALQNLKRDNEKERDKVVEDHLKLDLKLDSVLNSQIQVERKLYDIEKTINNLEVRVTRLETLNEK